MRQEPLLRSLLKHSVLRQDHILRRTEVTLLDAYTGPDRGLEDSRDVQRR
jgi:hypothetical protein